MSNEKETKLGIFSRISKFFSTQRGEMKKIVWPSKKSTINNTVVVIGVVAATSVVVGSFDAVLSLLMKLFLQA